MDLIVLVCCSECKSIYTPIMKLHGEPRRLPRLRAAEVIQPTEVEQEFTLLQLIPPEVWEEVGVMADIFEHSASAVSRLENLAQLAEFNPALAQRLRADGEIAEYMQRLIANS